ncbi:S41 family peptidase [Bacteroidota bacterium]
MKRKFVFTIILIFALCHTSNGQTDRSKTELKFNKALQTIASNYVDTVNQPQLVEHAIKAMIKELDPHSVYLTKKELDKANESLIGNFDGIGVTYQIIDDTIYIISTVRGGPSEKSGVLAGDRFIKIDGEEAIGSKIDNNYVQKKLRGKKGSEVIVNIYRKSTKENLEITIKRDKIPIYSVDAYFMLTTEIGYIKINRFAKNTMKEYQMGLIQLQFSGMKHLVLDLRGNSGGYLNTATNLADEFLEKDKLIVYTEGINNPKHTYNATVKGSFEKGKLVVLINEGSASASEIVAGAIQDWDRGLILGRMSFGKGLVQRPFYLPDGSAIRLTTARYYTPTGRCIQKPYSDGVDKYRKELSERYKHAEHINADSIDFPDSLKYYTPNKRIVYGGGGIMPDIFIPLDTTRDSKYYISLRDKGLLNLFILKYIDNNRENLKKEYPTYEVFAKDFNLNNGFFDSFLKFSIEKGVQKDDDGLEKSRKYIQYQLKALMARTMFENSNYYNVNVDIDDDIQKAIEIINKKRMFKKMDISYK